MSGSSHAGTTTSTDGLSAAPAGAQAAADGRGGGAVRRGVDAEAPSGWAGVGQPALAPYHFQDVLLVVNFNWQNYLTQYHNLIALFDQLYAPYFYDVKYMGDLAPCPHCRTNPQLKLNREHLREYNTSGGYNILEGLADHVREYKDRVHGVLYINDDILLDMPKMIRADKSVAWIAALSRNCSFDNTPTERNCPWGRWARVRPSYEAALASMPVALRERIDKAVGPRRYFMSYADMVYLPRAYFDDFVTLAPYFWREVVMSELAMVNILRTCGPIQFLPFTNIADHGRRAVRSFFDLVYQPDTPAYFAHGLKLSHVKPLNEIHLFRKVYGQLIDVTIGPRRSNVSRADPSLPDNSYTRTIPGDGFEVPP
jgi:hypothetical protein